jgi:hypothetical protein
MFSIVCFFLSQNSQNLQNLFVDWAMQRLATARRCLSAFGYRKLHHWFMASVRMRWKGAGWRLSSPQLF